MSDSELYCVTCCDPGNDQVDHLASFLNGDLIILESFDRKIGGVSKLIELHKFLVSTDQIRDRDLVVFMDALDVLCIDWSPQKITSDFQLMHCDVVVGAENRFSHQLSSVKDFYDVRGAAFRMRYLNSGFFIGYKYALLSMLERILGEYSLDKPLGPNSDSVVGKYHDQTLVSRFMWENSQREAGLRMELDYESRFVFTYTQDNLQTPFDEVASHFVHVCWLQNPANKEKYNDILKTLAQKKTPTG